MRVSLLQRSFMLTLVAAVMMATAASPALAQPENVFFSTVSSVGGGATVGTPGITHAPSDPGGSLYIWVTDGQRVNQSFALDVVSTTPGTIALTGATVFNPFVDLGIPSVSANRWQGTGAGVTSADAILNFSGVRVTEGFGLNSAVAASDPGHDPAAGAYLFARIDYDVIGLGTTSLGLRPGATDIVDGGVSVAGSYHYGRCEDPRHPRAGLDRPAACRVSGDPHPTPDRVTVLECV